MTEVEDSNEALHELRRERLREWMDKRGLNQREMADRAGVTRSYISLVLSRGKPFGEKSARQIERSAGMPDGYLDVSTKTLTPVVVWDKAEDLDPSTQVLINRVSVKLSAGNGLVNQEEEDMPPLAFRADWLSRKNVTSRSNLRTLEIKGDSMEPRLEDGDTVLIDLGQTTIQDNEVYAIVVYDDIKIKRLSRKFDGGVTITSDNPRYPQEQLSHEDAQQLRVVGKMIWRGG